MTETPMNLPPRALPEDEVHLYFSVPEEITDPSLLQRYHQLLNPDEAAQQKRFHFERHRHQYLITRAMIRTTLSRYVPQIKPEQWEFEKNQYGRPQIAAVHNAPPIHFNLSHTDGLIACGIVMDRELGVDVEDIGRGGGLINIADRFFSPSEVTDLHQLPPAMHTGRFFDYWTLKEAYIKARGMGLSIPLEDFSYHLSENHTDISISIAPKQGDPSHRWQFRQWRMGARHKIALCLEKRTGVDFVVDLKKLEPYAGETPFSAKEFRASKGWK